MRKLLLLLVIPIFISNGCKEESSSLEKITFLHEYPSGSGLAYRDNKIYLMGDDASYMLIADTGFNAIDTIQFFKSTEKRIAKEIKKDPEAIAIVSKNDTAFILVIGSGSSDTLRNYCWLINPITKQQQEIRLDTFYDRLKAAGIKELNIEGATSIPSGLLLVSRGNKSYPKNHLIFTTRNFWENQSSADIHLATIGIQKDTANFEGVSGLDYSPRKDLLFLTVSTENTYNTYQDGAIGKSYLWIVKDFTLKQTYSAINPFKIIDLESIDPRFKTQKIESVTLVSDIKDGEQIILVSDDDKGGSVLFKVDLLKTKE